MTLDRMQEWLSRGAKMMQKRKNILQIDQESVIVIPKTKLIEGLCNLTGNTFVQSIPWFFVSGLWFRHTILSWEQESENGKKTMILQLWYWKLTTNNGCTCKWWDINWKGRNCIKWVVVGNSHIVYFKVFVSKLPCLHCRSKIRNWGSVFNC